MAGDARSRKKKHRRSRAGKEEGTANFWGFFQRGIGLFILKPDERKRGDEVLTAAGGMGVLNQTRVKRKGTCPFKTSEEKPFWFSTTLRNL